MAKGKPAGRRKGVEQHQRKEIEAKKIIRKNYIDTSYSDQMAEERREQINQELLENYQQAVREYYNGFL